MLKETMLAAAVMAGSAFFVKAEQPFTYQNKNSGEIVTLISAERSAMSIEDDFFLYQWTDADGNLWEIAGRVDENGHGKATIAGPDGYIRNIEWSAKLPPRGSDPVSQEWLNEHPDFVDWFEQQLATGI